MDKELRKSFALKAGILEGDPGDVRSIKVLNGQISWKDGEIHWEADPRHIEILAKHLGLEGATTVKTPGDRNDSDKLFRYRDIDGEEDEQNCGAANYVDDLFTKGKHPNNGFHKSIEKLAKICAFSTTRGTKI